MQGSYVYLKWKTLIRWFIKHLIKSSQLEAGYRVIKPKPLVLFVMIYKWLRIIMNFWNKLSDLRAADDTSIRQTFGVTAAQPKHFVLSNPPDPIPEWPHVHLFLHLVSTNVNFPIIFLLVTPQQREPTVQHL